MKLNSLFLLLLLLCLSQACSDVIIPDLDGEWVNLVSPSDSLTTNNKNPLFLWDPVPDATYYVIQIATPSFNPPSEIILDSTITDIRFRYTLAPGTYEWQIIAFNEAYASECCVVNRLIIE